MPLKQMPEYFSTKKFQRPQSQAEKYFSWERSVRNIKLIGQLSGEMLAITLNLCL